MDDYAESLQEFREMGPEGYWAQKARMFKWFEEWDITLDESDPRYPKWFTGGKMNLCYDCLDRHVEQGNGGSVAYIFDSPHTKTSKKVTYGELLDQVSKLAGALHAQGLRIGDRVLIYLPMIPETVVTMLACCRLGLVYFVLMGSYTKFTIAERIDDFQPRLAVLANAEFGDSGIVYTKQLFDEGVDLSEHKPETCFVLQRSEFEPASMVVGRDLSFNDVVNESKPHGYVPVDVNQPCFIIYTSGTTGKPKTVKERGDLMILLLAPGGQGIIHSVRGVAMEMVQEGCAVLTLGKSASEVSWMVSTFAWIVGQAFVCYMPLYWRKTSILYEFLTVMVLDHIFSSMQPQSILEWTRTSFQRSLAEFVTLLYEEHLQAALEMLEGSVIRPNALDIYRVLISYDVSMLFLSIGALRYILRQDPHGKLASKFKPFSLIKFVVGGAPGDLATMNWSQHALDVYPLQCYGLTEVGGVITTTDTSKGRTLESQPLMSSGNVIPGLDVKILTEAGTEAAIGEEGRIVIKYPFPPALMMTIYKNDALFTENYITQFPGYFDLKDNGKFDNDGNLYVLNRNDTIFKAMGHRISCTSLEEVMMAHPDISECVVVTKFVDNEGDSVEIPEGFFLLKEGTTNSVDDIATEVVASVHQHLGKFITFPKPHHVEALPRTITGKVARGTVQEMLRKSTELKILPEDLSIQSLWHAIKATED